MKKFLFILALLAPIWTRADALDTYISERGQLSNAVARIVSLPSVAPAGPSGDQSLNLMRTPAMWTALQTSGARLRVLYVSDGQLNTEGVTTALRARLGQFLAPAGSQVGYSTVLYSSSHGGYYSNAAAFDTNWVRGYTVMTNNGALTNLTAGSSGIPTTRLRVGYWASNDLGTLSVNTQSFSSGSWGTKANVRQFNLNIGTEGGADTFVWTNATMARDTVLAGLTYSGTKPARVFTIVGQEDTGTNGFILDTISLGGFDLAFMMANERNQTVLNRILDDYDVLIVADIGSPEAAAETLEALRGAHTNRLDVVYLVPAPVTNNAAIAPAALSNHVQIARTVGAVVVDSQSLFRNQSVFDVNLLYTDETHLNTAGGEIVGAFVADTLGWTPGRMFALGYYPVWANATNAQVVVNSQVAPHGLVSIGTRLSGMTSVYTYSGDTTFNPASATGYKFNDSANSINAFTISDAGLARAVSFGVGSGSITLTTGSGSPESVVTAPVGSLFLRSDGGASTTLYVKTSGAGNTGWTAK